MPSNLRSPPASLICFSSFRTGFPAANTLLLPMFLFLQNGLPGSEYAAASDEHGDNEAGS